MRRCRLGPWPRPVPSQGLTSLPAPPTRAMRPGGGHHQGLCGSPGQGWVQLRPVPPQQHAAEERAQAPGIQEDRDNHSRPRLSDVATICWGSSSSSSLSPTPAAVDSIWLGVALAWVAATWLLLPTSEEASTTTP